MEQREYYKKLRNHFRNRKVTQVELAKFLNLSIGALNEKINRRNWRDFTPGEVRRLCSYYDLDAYDYFINPN